MLVLDADDGVSMADETAGRRLDELGAGERPVPGELRAARPRLRTAKSGAASRGDLVSPLFFDHYAGPLGSGSVARSTAGWP